MSIEEIINELDELQFILECKRDRERTGTGVWQTSNNRVVALRAAIEKLRTHQDAQPNEPLTEEEIKKMAGEPVYYPQGSDGKRWLIVDYIAITAVIGGAKLYRRPPKQAWDG